MVLIFATVCISTESKLFLWHFLQIMWNGNRWSPSLCCSWKHHPLAYRALKQTQYVVL